MSLHRPPHTKPERVKEPGELIEQAKNLQAEKRIFTSNFLLVWLGTFTSFGSHHLLLAVLPLYIVSMGGTETETGVVIGAFAAASVVARPFVGQASDLWGKKVFMLASAVTIFLAALLYNFAHGVFPLLAVRIMHGLGWGAFTTITATLTADVVPEHRRGEAVGYFSMASLISIAGLPVVGVLLQKSYGFPAVFYATTLIALACLMITLPVSEPPPERRNSPSTRHYTLSHLFERSALFASLVAGLLFLTHASIISFLPLVASQRGIENPGLFFTILAVTGILGRAVTGRLSDRLGRGVISMPGMAAAVCSLVVLSYAHSLTAFLVAASLFGLAIGTVQPDLMAFTIDRVAPQARGLAMSTYTTALDLGIWVGSFLWGVVAQFFGFTTMYLLAAMVALAGGIILLGYRLTGRNRTVINH